MRDGHAARFVKKMIDFEAIESPHHMHKRKKKIQEQDHYKFDA